MVFVNHTDRFSRFVCRSVQNVFQHPILSPRLDHETEKQLLEDNINTRAKRRSIAQSTPCSQSENNVISSGSSPKTPDRGGRSRAQTYTPVNPPKKLEGEGEEKNIHPVLDLPQK